MRLSRTMSYIREIRTLLNTPITECKFVIDENKKQEKLKMLL